MPKPLRIFGWFVSACLATTAAAGVQADDAPSHPALTTEISADHPLFIFDATSLDSNEPVTYAAGIVRVWGQLTEDLRPYSALLVEMRGSEATARQNRLTAFLDELAGAEIPVVLRVADADPRNTYPLDLTEDLLSRYTFIKGVQAYGLRFNEYPVFGGGTRLAEPPEATWLTGLLDAAARYGRFVAVELEGLHWARVMANTSCARLYAKIRQCAPYVVPIAACRDGRYIPQQSAAMGMWLEGAAAQWGIGPSSQWYSEAGFLAPGRFGRGDSVPDMPPALYRAMLLTGAMTGAAVYSFSPGNDLWFGGQSQHWHEAILPALRQLLDQGLIAQQRFASEKAQVAYQLAPASSSREFHLNSRDIDPVYDEGLLIHGCYGMEAPGQVAELIPNSLRHYYVPVLSPHAGQSVIERFAQVVQPGSMASAEAWTALLDRYYRPDGMGSASICTIGRGIFVLHNRENTFVKQTYRVPKAPAPVLGIAAKRAEQGVEVTWPFREGDVSYQVLRRDYPEGAFDEVASGIVGRSWVDGAAQPGSAYAYTVTALTNEEAAAEGTVNLGDYLARSAVESVPAEEAVVTPLVGFGKGNAIEEPRDTRPEAQSWWPSVDHLDQAQQEVTGLIAERLQTWKRAFEQQDLDGVMDLYATHYEDPEGWRFQYVRRAYQWFFERYTACRVQHQVREWDFTAFPETGAAEVTWYCRFSGVALTSPSGLFADRPAHFPRTETGEVVLRFIEEDGIWRIARTTPALPNFRSILSFSAGPDDALSLGPDVYRP